MLDEKNTAIVTCVDDIQAANLEGDFLRTLKEVGYKGFVYVIGYDINSEMKRRLEDQYNVTFFCYEKTQPVFSLRYKHIPDILDALPGHISNVMLIDCGDVWFQKPIMPIFEQTENKLGCVEEPFFFDKSEWVSLCLNNLKKSHVDRIMSNSRGKRNKNAGMICGPKNMVQKIIQNVYMDMIDTGIEFFGLDQLFFNYEANRLSDDDLILLDKEYNYVLINNIDFIYKNQKIYKDEEHIVTVVHNAGGAWRIFNRKYGALNKEEEEYLCDISRKWH